MLPFNVYYYKFNLYYIIQICRVTLVYLLIKFKIYAIFRLIFMCPFYHNFGIFCLPEQTCLFGRVCRCGWHPCVVVCFTEFFAISGKTIQLKCHAKMANKFNTSIIEKGGTQNKTEPTPTEVIIYY